jgi:uncharacterized membrane protein
MEAFSDGVIAILITVMVLELKVPHGTSWEALRGSTPVLLSYVLSFVYLGIYWNNHHHMLMLTDEVGGLILWANLHLLFWLSLVPFATGWMGENHFADAPVIAYGVVLLAAGCAYYLLQITIVRAQGDDGKLGLARGRDVKGKLSPVLLAIAAFVVVALMWLVPDKRVERTISARSTAGGPTTES